MLAELGHFAMALAASLALFTAICALSPLIGDLQRRQQLVRSQVIGQLVFSAIAFGALVASFLADDFSIAYVATHSNSLLPWYYKFSATWGGHECSFLLWINVMGLWMVAGGMILMIPIGSCVTCAPANAV